MNYSFAITSEGGEAEKIKQALLAGFGQLEALLDETLLEEDSEKKRVGTTSSNTTKIGYKYSTPASRFDSVANLKYDIASDEEKVRSVGIDIFHMEQESDSRILRVFDKISAAEYLEKTLEVKKVIEKIAFFRKGIGPEDLCIDQALRIV
jgi:hypothetical protein